VYNNNRYMRTEPVFAWSDEPREEKTPIPAHLVGFIENYYDEAIEFGFDAHDHAEQMLDAVRDHYPDLTDVELANRAIEDAF
jgi:hypothetical protein